MECTPDTKSSHPQRKQLPHHAPVERHNQPVIVFVTLTITPRGDYLANQGFHDTFLQACADANAWSVGRYMIMPDHVHFFSSPAKEPRVGLMQWVSFLKRRVTIRLSPEGVAESAVVRRARLAGTLALQSADATKFSSGGRASSRAGAEDTSGGRASPRAGAEDKPWRWQSECWDTQIRSGDHYHEKWAYVCQNPVRKELVAQAEDWPWQGELHVLRW